MFHVEHLKKNIYKTFTNKLTHLYKISASLLIDTNKHRIAKAGNKMSIKKMRRVTVLTAMSIALSSTVIPSTLVMADGLADVIQTNARQQNIKAEAAQKAGINLGENVQSATNLADTKKFNLGDSLYFGQALQHRKNGENEAKQSPILWDVISDKDDTYTLLSHYVLENGVQYDSNTAKFAVSNLHGKVQEMFNHDFSDIEEMKMAGSTIHSRQIVEPKEGPASVVDDKAQPALSKDWNTTTATEYMYLPEMLEKYTNLEEVNFGTDENDKKLIATIDNPLFEHNYNKNGQEDEQGVWTRTPFSQYVANAKTTSIPGQAIRLNGKRALVSDVTDKAGIRPIIRLKKADLIDLIPVVKAEDTEPTPADSQVADKKDNNDWNYEVNTNKHNNYRLTVVNANLTKPDIMFGGEIIQNSSKYSVTKSNPSEITAHLDANKQLAYKIVDAQTSQVVARGIGDKREQPTFDDEQKNKRDKIGRVNEVATVTLPTELPEGKYYQVYVWSQTSGAVTNEATTPTVFQYKADKDPEAETPAPKQDDYAGQLSVLDLKADESKKKYIYETTNYVTAVVQLKNEKAQKLESGTYHNYQNVPDEISKVNVKGLQSYHPTLEVDKDDSSKLTIELRDIVIQPGVNNITVTIPADENHFNKAFDIQIPVKRIKLAFGQNYSRNVDYTEDQNKTGLIHYKTVINIGTKVVNEFKENPSNFLKLDGAFANAKIDSANVTTKDNQGMLALNFSHTANFRSNQSSEGNIIFKEGALCYDDNERTNKETKIDIKDTYQPRVKWENGLSTTPSGNGSSDYNENKDVEFNGLALGRFVLYDTVQSFCRYEKEVIGGPNQRIKEIRKGLTGFFPMLDMVFGILDVTNVFRKPQQDLRVDPVMEKLKEVSRQIDGLSNQMSNYAQISRETNATAEKEAISKFIKQTSQFSPINAPSVDDANTLKKGLQVTRLLALIASEVNDTKDQNGNSTMSVSEIKDALQSYLDAQNGQLPESDQLTMDDLDLAFKKLYQLSKDGSVVQSSVDNSGNVTSRSFLDKAYSGYTSAVALFNNIDENTHTTTVKSGDMYNIFDLFDQYMTKLHDFNNETFVDRQNFYSNVGTQMALLHFMDESAMTYDYYTWETKQEKNQAIIEAINAEVGTDATNSAVSKEDWNKAQSIIKDAKAQKSACTKPINQDLENIEQEDIKFDAIQVKLKAENANLKEEQDKFKNHNYLYSYRIKKGLNKLAPEVSTTEIIHKLDKSFGIASEGTITNGQSSLTGLYGNADKYIQNTDQAIKSALNYSDVTMLTNSAQSRGKNLYQELDEAGVKVQNEHRHHDDLEARHFWATGTYNLNESDSRILAGSISHTGQVGKNNGQSNLWEYYTQGMFVNRENGELKEYKEHVKMNKYDSGSYIGGRPAVCELTVNPFDQQYTTVLQQADTNYVPTLQPKAN